MAWRLKKVEEQRKDLVDAYMQGTATMIELCERFGVSRKTAYKWYRRYKKQGDEGLKDQSKAPIKPNTVYSNDIIIKAIDKKLKYRHWGPKKIIANLNRHYPNLKMPSATRLYIIFKENNLILPRRLRSQVPATHPLGELNGSNHVWIGDFKGWFLTGDNKKCEPLTITDGYSRYLIKCEQLLDKTAESVWPVFKEAFLEYGLPIRIRTDNGPPFGSVGAGRLTELSIKFIKAGVLPEWINPGHPEENGRHERFHLTLKEAIANPPAKTLEEQMIRMAHFQEEYNNERPHEGLQMNRPSDYYTKSTRRWDGVLRGPEYNTSEMIVRKVGQNGCVWVRQYEYYIGHTLKGEYVGIKEKEGGALDVQYGPVHLGELKEGNKRIEKPKLVKKSIVRRG
jgi:putative transposase